MNIFKIGLIPQHEAPTPAENEVQPMQDPLFQELVAVTTFTDTQQACKAYHEGKISGIVHKQPHALPQAQGKEMLTYVSPYVRMACATSAPDVAQTARQLTAESIVERIKQINHIALRDFLLTHPRVAVLSLHADDQHEETDILMPAIEDAMAEGINVFGPFPPTAFFKQGDYRFYDVILALFPGQAKELLALTPDEEAISYLAESDTMQVSPCHPTAFVGAIFHIKDVLRNRHNYDEANNDPLQKLYHEKRDR